MLPQEANAKAFASVYAFAITTAQAPIGMTDALTIPEKSLIKIPCKGEQSPGTGGAAKADCRAERFDDPVHPPDPTIATVITDINLSARASESGSWAKATGRAKALTIINNKSTNPAAFGFEIKWGWIIEATTQELGESAYAWVRLNVLLDGESLIPEKDRFGVIGSEGGHNPAIDPIDHLSGPDHSSGFERVLSPGLHTLQIDPEGGSDVLLEPGTIALLSMGGGILICWRRRVLSSSRELV